MLDLILWSFLLALTPVALGLAWRLMTRAGAGLAPGYDLEHTEAWLRDPMRPVDREALWNSGTYVFSRK